MLHGQVHIGQGLGFDALGGVNHQQRPFAGSQGPGYFVGKVHMPRGVDQVQHILLSVFGLVMQLNSLILDGDAPFSFQ